MSFLAPEKIEINDKSACLSQKSLRQYAHGRLSEKEKKKAEDHLIECETCIASYQEILNRKDALEADVAFAELFEQPQKKTPVDKSKIIKTFLTATFAMSGIAVLFSVYFIFSKQQITDENAYSPKSEITNGESPPLRIDKPEVSDVFVSTEKINKPVPVSKEKVKENIPLEKKNKEEITVKPKPQTALAVNAEQTKAETPKNTEIKISPSKSESTQKNSEEPLKKPAVAVLINGYKISQSTEKSALTNEYKKEMEFIFRQINQKSYNEALNEIGSFFSDKPDDSNAKYYSGFIYYLLEDNTNALTYFEWILNKKDKIFYEDASWYKALILNRTQNFTEAKKVLNRIIASNGAYSSRASQLLDLIGQK